MKKVTKKRALCVGINDYENYPQSALNGCVNDVDTMKRILMDYLDYDESEIVTLINENATKENIMAELGSMIDGANGGQYESLVYSHSGHGTVIPTTDPSEPDGLNESFCPYDLADNGDRWDSDHIIQDDEFFNLFSTLDKNVSLEVFLDTCHSGTGLKLMELSLDRRPRFMPMPTRKASRDIQERRAVASLLRTMKPDGTKAEDKSLNVTLWAACKAEQTSADAKIEGDWHGAFTYYFAKSVDDQGGLTDRDAIYQNVVDQLKIKDFDQTPQYEKNPLEIEVSHGPL